MCPLEITGEVRKKAWTTKKNRDARAAPDLVERDFSSAGPYRLWVADITCIPTWSGFLCLAVVLDAWGRNRPRWSAGLIRMMDHRAGESRSLLGPVFWLAHTAERGRCRQP